MGRKSRLKRERRAQQTVSNMRTTANDGIAFLLGAGASYGHLDGPDRETPPIMSLFLSRAVKRGILTVQEFPELAKECSDRGGKDTLLESCISLESDGLDLESFLSSIKDLWTLQLSRFFLWRYMGEFSRQLIGNDSAYRTLAAFIKNRKNNVLGMISLNYDTLCESALASEEIKMNYSLAPDAPRGLLYLKPHGSVNFRFPMGKSFISMRVADWPSVLKSHNSIIETNKFSGRWVEEYRPTFSFESDFLADTSGTRTLYYIPAIVPPLGRSKYHEQFDSYQLIWNNIDSLLRQTTVLVVLGSALNDEEFKLWNSLECHLSKDSEIRVVSANLVEARKVEKRLIEHQFKKVVPLDVAGFYGYSKRYLEVGSL